MTSIPAATASLLCTCPWGLSDLESGLQAIKLTEGKMMGKLHTQKKENLYLSGCFGIIGVELQATVSETCDMGFLWAKTMKLFII